MPGLPSAAKHRGKRIGLGGGRDAFVGSAAVWRPVRRKPRSFATERAGLCAVLRKGDLSWTKLCARSHSAASSESLPEAVRRQWNEAQHQSDDATQSVANARNRRLRQFSSDGKRQRRVVGTGCGRRHQESIGSPHSNSRNNSPPVELFGSELQLFSYGTHPTSLFPGLLLCVLDPTVATVLLIYLHAPECVGADREVPKWSN